MRCIRIIPRLDVKGDSLVKGVNLEGIRKLGRPEEFAKYYYQQGADELIYMDVVASLYNRNSLLDLISRTSNEISIPLAVGGGVRTLEDIYQALRAGADKVVINTAAIKKPELIKEAAEKYGSSTIVVSIEAKKIGNFAYEAYIDCGREKTGFEAFAWAQQAADLGAGELMVTSIDNEGTGKGFDSYLIAKIAQSVKVPVIASGGAGNAGNVVDVLRNGKADAVALASLLHYSFLRTGLCSSSCDFKKANSPLSGGRGSALFETVSLQQIKDALEEQGFCARF